ncbi:hypothetical protein SDC9_152872 [bioreactor metagenome]|uniref:Uncharacterized protein n=1 Tax=bioreactor metagenome TaxID=1076179 RepID=A0A645EUB8_9ZZZZ
MVVQCAFHDLIHFPSGSDVARINPDLLATTSDGIKSQPIIEVNICYHRNRALFAKVGKVIMIFISGIGKPDDITTHGVEGSDTSYQLLEFTVLVRNGTVIHGLYQNRQASSQKFSPDHDVMVTCHQQSPCVPFSLYSEVSVLLSFCYTFVKQNITDPIPSSTF